jgi:hypothetical protein
MPVFEKTMPVRRNSGHFTRFFRIAPEPENCTTLSGDSAAGIVQYPDFSFRRENYNPGAETVPVF